MPQTARWAVAPPDPQTPWPAGYIAVLREAGAQEKAIPFRGIALGARPDGAEPSNSPSSGLPETVEADGESPLPQDRHANYPIVPQWEVKRTPVAVRPLPRDENWFETTWAAWQNGQIFRDV